MFWLKKENPGEIVKMRASEAYPKPDGKAFASQLSRGKHFAH
jgi:hypothetical protein